MSNTVTFEPQTPTDAGAPKKRTGRKVLAYGAVGLTSLFVGMGIGGAAASGGSTSAGGTPTPSTVTKTVEVPGPATTKTVEAPAAPAPAPSAPAPKAGPKTTIDGNGTFVVGQDIEPGKYKTAGPIDPSGAYYEILKDPAGSSFDNMVSNGFEKGQAFVTLKAGQGFKTDDFQPWVKVG